MISGWLLHDSVTIQSVGLTSLPHSVGALVLSRSDLPVFLSACVSFVNSAKGKRDSFDRFQVSFVFG